MQRDNRITAIQFYCTILIVVLHASNVGGWNLQAMDDVGFGAVIMIQEIISHIGQMAVPVFFFFSGFLFYKNFEIQQYSKKLKSRVWSLLVPYLFWNTLVTAFYAALTNIPVLANVMNMDKIEINPKILITILNSDSTPLWYVRNLMILTLVSVLWNFLIKKMSVAIGVIITLVIANCILGFDYHSILYWLPEYLVGAYIGKHYGTFTFEKSKNNNLSVIGLSVILTAIAIISFLNNTHIWMVMYRFTVSLCLPCILGYLISKDCVLPEFSKCTLYIYAAHFVVLSSIQKIMKIVLSVTPFTSMICYIVSPILTLFIMWVVSIVWKKLFPRLWSIVNGGRA